MNILVVGGSGATGRWLVKHLLDRGHAVRIIVRSPERLPDFLKDQPRLSIIQASLLELSDAEMVEQVRGCEAVASCLGHNLTFKGIYGKPRKLVTEAVRRLCLAIRSHSPQQAVKFVLMSTVAYHYKEKDQPLSLPHKLVLGLIRMLVPPHSDNEQAAEYLRLQVGKNDHQIEWVAVRPDSLIDEEEVSPYDLYPSPIRSGVFDPGKSSRINVAHFMADLITDEQVGAKWSGSFPVLYNVEGGADR
jgi:nucleoside-diphosphate-sugar epimerase